MAFFARVTTSLGGRGGSPLFPRSLVTATATPRGWWRSFSSQGQSEALLPGEDPSFSNITPAIREKVGKNIYQRDFHPIKRMKDRIVDYFANHYRSSSHVQPEFTVRDDLSPIVSVGDNFDALLIPHDHPGRRKQETYYLSEKEVLRTHATCHQVQFLAERVPAYIAAGDVYRRDTIDATHYPVFHQLDAGRLFTAKELEGQDAVSFVQNDMKSALEGLARHLFGNVESRWIDEYFPFTDPSNELEIQFRGEWVEVLGCGVIHRNILRHHNVPDDVYGWAFGIGLERLAMILHDIPDIRLFWTDDERFHSQFTNVPANHIVKFKPFSSHPPCIKDVAFWVGPSDGSAAEVDENDVMEVLREAAGDLVESAALIDSFTHPKTKRESRCYRIHYRHMGRTLTNEEVNELQAKVREGLTLKLPIELR